MALYTPAYRLTIMAPATTDAFENTPLTPASGAIHSDPFRVATVVVSGSQPYLDLPQGRKSRYDPTTGRVDIGQLNFRLLDKRTTTTSNLQRWMTAFIGDSTGKILLRGLRVTVEESLDWNSATASGSWSPFFVGRVGDVSLDDPQWYNVSVREANDELTFPCFVGRPALTATGSALLTLWPLGISSQYGPVSADTAMTGSVGTLPSLSYPFVTYAQRRVTLSATSLGATNNVYSDALNIANTLGLTTALDSPQNSGLRLRLTSGSTVAEFRVIQVNQGYSATKSILASVDYSAFDYNPILNISGAIDTIPTGSTVGVAIIPDAFGLSKDNPLLLTTMHPVAILNDLVLGRYGYLDSTTGAPLRSMSVDTSAMATLLADPSFPTVRYAITQESTPADFIEKEFGPLGIGYRIEPRTVSGSIVGVFVPFDARLPTTLSGLPSITNTDIADMAASKWMTGVPLKAITLKTPDEVYTPYQIGLSDNQTTVQTSTPTLSQTDNTFYYLLPENVTLDADSLNVALQGLRGIKGDSTAYQDANRTANTGKGYVLTTLAQRFGSGPATAELVCRRTSTINGLKSGQWALVTVDTLPDPSTHLRGGTRLMQVTERSENGATVTLRLMDAGQNVFTTAPTMFQPVTQSWGYSVDATATTSQRLHIQAARVSIGSAQPASSASQWTTVFFDFPTSNSRTSYPVQSVPAGYRYYVRGRTESTTAQLPSAWQYPGFVDKPALPAVTNLRVSSITPNSAVVSWTPADAQSTAEVSLQASGGVMTPVAYLVASSSQYTLDPLTGSQNPYTVQIRLTDTLGSLGTAATTTFSVSGSLSKCPNLVFFYATNAYSS